LAFTESSFAYNLQNRTLRQATRYLSPLKLSVHTHTPTTSTSQTCCLQGWQRARSGTEGKFDKRHRFLISLTSLKPTTQATLTVAAVVKKFPAFREPARFNTNLATARSWTLAGWIQSTLRTMF
jgi:hypothetical protein